MNDSPFSIVKNDNGTYHIECLFIVYREKFGHHPDFLPQDEERGKREGFNTKFWFLVMDYLSAAEAQRRLTNYENLYSALIHEIENDDTRWDEFPFKNKQIVYCK